MNKTILMCDPGAFNVNYVINPWMTNNFHNIDKIKSINQWNNLYLTLKNIGVNVKVLLPPPSSCPDAVFVANAGLLFKNQFILSKFKHLERSQEEEFFYDWFSQNLNVDIKIINESRTTHSFEGAGDALFSHNKNILWFAHGFRSNYNAKVFLDQNLENFDHGIIKILRLELPEFYHLDTCFCPLDTGYLLWYPPAFDDYSQYLIESWFKDYSIPVTKEDALRFACNAVSVQENIIIPIISKELEQQLISTGHIVHQVDMSQFLRSGGACKCLTLEHIF